MADIHKEALVRFRVWKASTVDFILHLHRRQLFYFSSFEEEGEEGEEERVSDEDDVMYDGLEVEEEEDEWIKTVGLEDVM